MSINCRMPGAQMSLARASRSLLLDIGTHAFHLCTFVTGRDVSPARCADLGSAIPGRKVDDYVPVFCIIQGARGSLWVTNAAAGAEHGLSFQVHGDKGGPEWHQEEPNVWHIEGREASIRSSHDGSGPK